MERDTDRRDLDDRLHAAVMLVETALRLGRDAAAPVWVLSPLADWLLMHAPARIDDPNAARLAIASGRALYETTLEWLLRQEETSGSTPV